MSTSFDRLSKSNQLIMKNKIVLKGKCGFANGGKIAFVKNTDTSEKYLVTIEEKWRVGIDSGEEYFEVEVGPGGMYRLGCTSGPSIPTVRRGYAVLGETPMEVIDLKGKVTNHDH